MKNLKNKFWGDRVLTIDELDVVDAVDKTSKKIVIVGERHNGSYTKHDEEVRKKYLDIHGEYLLVPESPDFADFHPQAKEVVMLDPHTMEGEKIDATQNVNTTYGKIKSVYEIGFYDLFFALQVECIIIGIASQINKIASFHTMEELVIIASFSYSSMNVFNIVNARTKIEFRDRGVITGLASEGMKDVTAPYKTIVIHAGEGHHKGLIRGLKNPQIARALYADDWRSKFSPDFALHIDKETGVRKKIPLGARLASIRATSHQQVFNVFK